MGRGRKKGEEKTTVIFSLVESKMIFTENVVGYYTLENYFCNLPVGNSLKLKSRL